LAVYDSRVCPAISLGLWRQDQRRSQ
jgi:hypothetical protein